jgi:hypothetical protein
MTQIPGINRMVNCGHLNWAWERIKMAEGQCMAPIATVLQVPISAARVGYVRTWRSIGRAQGDGGWLDPSHSAP